MNKRKLIPTIAAAVCFLLAVGITLYPAISSYVNEKYRSAIHTNYVAVMEQTDDHTLQAAREQALAYNKAITPGTTMGNGYTREALLAASENYENLLNIAGNGIMGYIEIPAIKVNLPIYHGTGSDTLERGVGHLLGSSLPVGGESTHTILTGHSGMATQKMFTDLEQLEIGDVFYIHVLNDTLAYQVRQTEAVLPHDTSLLNIVPGEDLATLVTCHPIGVNSHRLLVMGYRIPYEEAQEVQQLILAADVEPESSWMQQYMLGIWLGIGAALTGCFVLLLYKILKRKHLRKRGGRYAEEL